MGCRLAVAFILAVLMAGNIAQCESYESVSTTAEITFKLDQSVSGTGFYNNYQNISMGHISLNNMNHGSGSYVYDAKTDAKASNYGQIGTEKTQQNIRLMESLDAVYSKTTFGIRGSTGALNFNSPINALTCTKNYGQGAEMNSEFLYANYLKKDTDSSLYWNSNSSNAIWEDSYEKAQGITSLSLEAEFQGRGHIGAQAIELGKKHLMATTLIDEVYSGEFAITKKMNLMSLFNETAVYEDWLPCCTGGWNRMDIHDQRGHGSSARGIFDCSCYKVPSMAEFPIQGK